MVNWCTAVSLLTSLLLSRYIQGQCPAPRETLCSSCINDTAVCSRGCIGNSTSVKDYVLQICTGHHSVIRNVDLSFNSLDYLDCSTNPSIKLSILNISHNNITIDDCNYWENNCYNAFKYLEYIDLSFNTIKNFCNASSFPLSRLKHVNLSYNEVTSLDNLPFFSGANNIRVADLSHNHISYLPCDLLRNKPKLISLNISYNNFGKLWICYNLQPEPKGIFDYRIYNASTYINVTIFDNDTQSQLSHVRICVVSISSVEANSSLCYEDALSNVTREELFIQRTSDNKTDESSQANTYVFIFYTPCYKKGNIVRIETTQLPKSTSLGSTSVEDPSNTKTSSSSEVSTTKSSSSQTETLLYVVILCSLSVIFITCAFSVYVVRKLSHIASQPISPKMKPFEYSKQSLDTSDKPPKLPRRSFFKKLKMKYTMKKANSLLSSTRKNSFNLNTMRPLPKVPASEPPGVGNKLSQGVADEVFSQNDKESLKETNRNNTCTSVDLAANENSFDSRKSPFCEKRPFSFYNEFSKSSIRKRAYVTKTALQKPSIENLTAGLSHGIAFSNHEASESVTSDNEFTETESNNLTEIVNPTKGRLEENCLEEPKNDDDNADLNSLQDYSTTDTLKEPSDGRVENTVVVDVEMHSRPQTNGSFGELPEPVVYNPSFLNNEDDKSKNNYSRHAQESETITLEPINLIALEEETLHAHTMASN